MQIRSAIYVVFMTIDYRYYRYYVRHKYSKFREFAASIFRVEGTEDLNRNIYSFVYETRLRE